jgi:hypothetical protein
MFNIVGKYIGSVFSRGESAKSDSKNQNSGMTDKEKASEARTGVDEKMRRLDASAQHRLRNNVHKSTDESTISVRQEAGPQEGLSSRSLEYVHAVMSKPALMNSDTCTTVMQGVMKLLGTGPVTVLHDGPATKGQLPLKLDRDGVYSLALNFGPDIHQPGHNTAGWEHGMVLQKSGNDVVLYQAWVGQYTLREWMEGTDAVSEMALGRSPKNANNLNLRMQTWLNMTNQLGELINGDYARLAKKDKRAKGLEQAESAAAHQGTLKQTVSNDPNVQVVLNNPDSNNWDGAKTPPDEKNFGAFRDMCPLLFGTIETAKSSRLFEMQMNGVAGTPLHYHLKHQDLKPLPEEKS